ncbi:MAG TPA: imidazole glycerol phosphate synthase subunit HisH [Solirubrobacteraceae bacterium]|jgi:glutamine amidotransferase|nr:imidazole glycerol phosphate synthase subunit HisH [Solirubrobacteraceae bacterium]
MSGEEEDRSSVSGLVGQAPPSIGILDYGMGNRRSVEKALIRVGASAFVSRDHERLRKAAALVLPGVGAFPAAMRTIAELGLDELLQERVAAGVPLFGSCLGMQLLFERSEEHGGAEGLALLAGEVTRLRADGLKLPHIGWSEVQWCSQSPLRDGVPEPTSLYHVHGFAVRPADSRIVVATAEYGERFPAVIASGNIYGAQSHPEKSSKHGLALLANFARICAGAAADVSVHA